MNILFLSTWFPYPPDNGSRIRAHYLLRALARQHSVCLVAFQPGREPGICQELSTRMDNVQIHSVPVDPFRYVHLPRWIAFASPIPLAFWPVPEMHQAVRRLRRSRAWDVVVAVQAPVARYALQVPAIARILDVDTAMGYQLRERAASQTRFLSRVRCRVSADKARLFESRMCRRFEACLVASPREREHVQSLMHGATCLVHTVPNGVDCERNRPGLAEPRSGSLIFNGALTYSANYDAMRFFLSEVYPLVRQQIPGVELSITGSTEGVDLSGLRLNGSVHLTGYLDDVRPAVAGASVCAVPIRQGGGTRLKVLEAMALGTPVVATTKAAEGLEVTHGRDILIADEPADFAAQLVRLLCNPALGVALAANARQLAERQYDWSAIGQRFVALVETAARPGRR